MLYLYVTAYFSQSLDCIKQGLADPYIRTGHKLALQLRAQKILKSKKKHLAERASEFRFEEVMEMPKVHCSF